MGWSSYDDLINQVTVNGKMYQGIHNKYAAGATYNGLNVQVSYWQLLGIPGVGGNGAGGSGTPGAGGTAYTNGDGSLNFPNQSPATKHILSASTTTFNTISSTLNNTLTIYDRLVSVGGISLGSVATTNINNVALPRYTSGLDVEAWIEVSAAVSSGTATVELLSYTNELGVSGRVGSALALPQGAAPVGLMMPLGLQSGDQGIRTVETFRVTSASSGGTVNLVLLRRLAMVPCISNQVNEFDFVTQFPWMPQIFDGASLGYMLQNGNTVGTSSMLMFGAVRVGYGG